jgi:drug/metabolite transporter (DMT)-like permease
MESRKLTPTKFLGIIIGVSAIGLMILKYITNGNYDSFMLPIILLVLGSIIYSRKPEKESKQIVTDPKTRKMIISALSVLVITGIIVFITILS